MIYYIINESFTNIIAFVSILFAFAFTIAAIALGKNLLPRDAGRAYAINGSKSVGKPRGAGMIFILTFTVTCALFVNLSAELIIYLILVLAAMLSGYLDDSASSPWGNLKKGLIDLAISVMAAVTYLHYNPNTFDLAFFGKTVTLNPIIYAILIIILIWVSINAGSRAIGIFIAFTFLKLHAPLLYIPMALVIILDGGLGLIKVSFMRFLHINLMKNLRTPIHDHMRKNKDWSDTQVVFRFTIIQVILGLAVIYGLMF